MRRYLREFLSDRRVVELNRVLWWGILNFLILPRRPARSAALYRRIWTDKGSPLLLTTLEQARQLEEALEGRVRVEVGMRYGNPSIGRAIDTLCGQGMDRILVFPMYPQYAAATTGSIYDAVGRHMAKRRVLPALRYVPPYYGHPAYISAWATLIREELARLPWKPEKLLVSFHGLPRRQVDQGDVYRQHVETTTSLLVNELGLQADEYELCFQSRFGKEEWLQPYTDSRLQELPKSGVRRIAAVCPGFVTDCLETLDEVGHEGKRLFLSSGGEDLHLVPCLNTHPAWLRAMTNIAHEELAGWI